MARHAKKIDTVHWTNIRDSVGSLAAGTAARLMGAAQHLPETILRIRGEWCAWIEGAQAGGAGFRVSVGLILVPEGTGSTVLWSPNADGDAPWIWWDTASLSYEEYVADVVWNDGGQLVRRVVDSKAMRKNRNMELQWVVENVTEIGAGSANVALSARVLSGA